MSPCCGSVQLLVLLGVVVTSGSPVQYLSRNLIERHRFVSDKLGLNQPDMVAHQLFTPVIKSINASCQRRTEVQLINATLDVYARIFSSILQQDHNKNRPLLDQVPESERSEVRTRLQELRQMMDSLKRNLGHLNVDREDIMDKLNKIKVDEPTVQRKALAQFKEVYQAASVISHRCGHAHSPSTA